MNVGHALATRSGRLSHVVATAIVIAAVALVVAVDFPMGANARIGHRGATLTAVLDHRDGAWLLSSGNGKPLFTFSRDTRKSSQCSNRCSRVWVPFITRGSPQLKGSYVLKRLVGAIRRSDGQLQVTYNHEPLYREPTTVNYCADTIPHQFGGSFAWIDASGSHPTGACGLY
jgi:predicted lipoprotein with Yx(FWY)xxD motif